MPTRILNWDVALHGWARSVVGRPFVWGETDCGTLVRQALAVMYGQDLFPEIPPYDSQTAALRVQIEHGDVAAHMARLGADVVPLAFLQQGDIVIGEADEDAPGAAVALGPLVLGTVVELGVRLVPVHLLPAAAAQGYRVPFTLPALEER